MNHPATFARESLRLLYWVFFKPSELHAYLKLIAPELPSESGLVKTLRELQRNAALRSLLLQALLLIVLLPLLATAATGLASTALGSSFDWALALRAVAVGGAFGGAVGVAFGGAGGVAGGVAVGGAGGVAFGVAFGGAFGVALVVTEGGAFGGAVGGAVGGAFGVGIVAGVLRLPFYLFEAGLALYAYRQARQSVDPLAWLRRSPVVFDELLVLPQPRLAAFLLLLARADLPSGLQALMQVAHNPFQRWAVQRALRDLLDGDGQPCFALLDAILRNPLPYRPVGSVSFERRRADDPAFSAKLLLAELAGVPAPYAAPFESIARWSTSWLRGARSRYAPLARAYLDLFKQKRKVADLLPVFAAVRDLPGGSELYQSFSAIAAAQQATTLPAIAACAPQFAPLLALEAPLRPAFIAVLRHLNDAVIDVNAFLSAEHPLNRRDALLQAQSALEAARQSTAQVYQPEQQLLLAIIEQWRPLISDAGGQLVAGQSEDEVLPNPYIAGRALNPSDGRRFVGRGSLFRQIEQALQNGDSIVLYGQRRMGKSSVLLHLKQRLPHTLLPVYIDLKGVLAQTTAGLLEYLAEEITWALREAKWPTMPLPARSEWGSEPFITFNRLLTNIQRGLQPAQRLVLLLDEFEELERWVKEGRVAADIFNALRSITATRQGFALVFAGLHTLEQMTYDYWHPFFNGVKRIAVSYLEKSDAQQLIIDPMDGFPLRYEPAAVEQIIAFSNGQPYLLQALCANLVNRLNEPRYRSKQATLADIDAVLEQTLESGTYYFEDYIWGYSDEHQRLVLALIADAAQHSATGWVEVMKIEQHLDRQVALRALDELIRREILEQQDNAGVLEYRFRVELSRRWVARTHPLARLLLEPRPQAGDGRRADR